MNGLIYALHRPHLTGSPWNSTNGSYSSYRPGSAKGCTITPFKFHLESDYHWQFCLISDSWFVTNCVNWRSDVPGAGITFIHNYERLVTLWWVVQRLWHSFESIKYVGILHSIIDWLIRFEKRSGNHLRINTLALFSDGVIGSPRFLRGTLIWLLNWLLSLLRWIIYWLLTTSSHRGLWWRLLHLLRWCGLHFRCFKNLLGYSAFQVWQTSCVAHFFLFFVKIILIDLHVSAK